ncbi:hypothetical protein CPB84DRAFT_1811096 [Gymnopilus junonius]|uniref:HNH nuclease domain-containing protein n=1 Tax=Gymnopilus junonius TaxID=109634 RepID=A0A9P5TEB0_GYMJU|nr:hypothetical protein CPB84DRAFT_1811096 [Gymnopilus junonius]
MCSLTLTSCSSEAAVELYEERLKPGIDALRNSCTPLRELVGAAEKIIHEKFAPDSRSTYKYKKGSKEISVGLDKVMLAMLACVEECGGESGKRYVACAILVCSEEDDVVGALQALGTIWLTHLLFIFKASKDHGNQSNEKPSGLATPTVNKTATHFLERVLKRDGYACVVTGYQDSKHPNPGPDDQVNLISAHILRRAIGQFDNDHNSKSFRSAVITFDILTLEELHNELDDPSNGVTLELNAHKAFDQFKWCLKATEKEHVYDLKIFKSGGLLRKPENMRISFQDHGNDFLPASTRKRNHPVNLPDPRYFAIHAAIAGVLNMSGGGRFFDELLDKYKDDRGNVPPVRSWPELEALVEEELLDESIAEGFQIVAVH